MSGATTGGEHLKALEAVSTGRVIDAEGIGLFLSPDALAGSAAAAPAPSAKGNAKKNASKKVTRKKVRAALCFLLPHLLQLLMHIKAANKDRRARASVFSFCCKAVHAMHAGATRQSALLRANCNKLRRWTRQQRRQQDRSRSMAGRCSTTLYPKQASPRSGKSS